MDTRLEMETELLKQIQASANSSLFPSARLTTLIQNAYKEATTLFKWVALSKALTTSTINKWAEDDCSYYDYPDEFRLNTVFRVQIDGKEYNRKGFESFLDYRNRHTTPNLSNSKRIFASYQKFLFISPDTVAGTNNMDIWGITTAPELSLPTSTTIFSNNMEAGNLAVISLALSVAVKNINAKLSLSERQNALLTLGKMNTDEWDEYARDQQLDTPLFEVPDFFGSPNINGLIGKFEYDVTERY